MEANLTPIRHRHFIFPNWSSRSSQGGQKETLKHTLLTYKRIIPTPDISLVFEQPDKK